MNPQFLFSVDLEDVRDHVKDGYTYAERVPLNTERYLRFCRDHGVLGTFFVVGSVAERYPGLVRDIVAEGHEIGCHTARHVQLTKQTPEEFRADLERNVEALQRCGARDIVGFRAPTFSLVKATSWAYGILAELGFEYSSSVFPARNPLYGWPEFGAEPRRIDGILEMPITLHSRLGVPLAGGVHFRVLPWLLIERDIRGMNGQGGLIHSYFHPYDIDSEQEPFMHPDLSDNMFYNALMYLNRDKVIPRLENLMQTCDFTNYRDYLKNADL